MRLCSNRVVRWLPHSRSQILITWRTSSSDFAANHPLDEHDVVIWIREFIMWLKGRLFVCCENFTNVSLQPRHGWYSNRTMQHDAQEVASWVICVSNATYNKSVKICHFCSLSTIWIISYLNSTHVRRILLSYCRDFLFTICLK